MTEMIITNGGSSVDLLRAAGRDGTILPWNDVLHEGPITAARLSDCSPGRIDYLAHRFRLDRDRVAAEFDARDKVVANHADFERIELWFEHDLYDQLQLVQILAFFADEGRTAGLSLIQADDFLGTQSPETILSFADKARPVEQADLDIAAALWAALAMPTPEAAADRMNAVSRFPFLRPALIRFLQELPAPDNGLSRTEQTILTAIAAGTDKPLRLFPEVTGQEEASFMGDWSFFRILDDLASSDQPLIAGLAPPGPAEEEAERLKDATLALTEAGDNVIAGRADHVALSGIDRWWGGMRLAGRAVWRYDRSQSRLVPPARSDA